MVAVCQRQGRCRSDPKAAPVERRRVDSHRRVTVRETPFGCYIDRSARPLACAGTCLRRGLGLEEALQTLLAFVWSWLGGSASGSLLFFRLRSRWLDCLPLLV